MVEYFGGKFLCQFLKLLLLPVIDTSSVDVPTDHAEVLNFIHSSYNLKPTGLVMKELKWKYLVRSAVRGKNILMTDPCWMW